jgi:hypothetical protein
MLRTVLAFGFALALLAACGPRPEESAPPLPAPDEAAAIAALKAVNQAQQDFIRRTRRYAQTYQELVDAHLLAEAPAVAKTGYEITMRPSPDAVSYTLAARPGRPDPPARQFFTDNTGVIRAELGREPTAASPEI